MGKYNHAEFKSMFMTYGASQKQYHCNCPYGPFGNGASRQNNLSNKEMMMNQWI